MALTEDQVLISFDINVQSDTISILWHNRILRDGDVISATPHRGAYELIEDELPEHIRDQVNISIAQFTDESILSFSKQNAVLGNRVIELGVLVESLQDEKNNLLGLISERDNFILSLQKQLGAMNAGTE